MMNFDSIVANNAANKASGHQKKIDWIKREIDIACIRGMYRYTAYAEMFPDYLRYFLLENGFVVKEFTNKIDGKQCVMVAWGNVYEAQSKPTMSRREAYDIWAGRQKPIPVLWSLGNKLVVEQQEELF